MRSEFLFRVNDPDNPAAEALALNLGVGSAGQANSVGINTSRNGIIKSHMSTDFPKDSNVNRLYSTQTGTIQSSAFVMTGGSFLSTQDPLNYVSYVYKPLTENFKHFGARMRIVGKIENNEINTQTAYGSGSVYSSVSGASGGIAAMINPETNNGYYYEIIALTDTDVSKYPTGSTMYDVVFYKVVKDTDTGEAIPVILWGGNAGIVVDSGEFVGQYRMVGEENPSVYDLGIEYEDIGSRRKFYLYMNDKLIKTVEDSSPLPVYNNMATFIRGNAKCMFENIYAIGANYSQNISKALAKPLESTL